MPLQELPHQVELLASPENPGSETCIVALAGGDYISRTVHANYNNQRYQTDYYWSVREQYNSRMQAACEYVARLVGSEQQESVVRLHSAPSRIREDTIHRCGQVLSSQGLYPQVRSLVHIMPRISIFWEHAKLPPSSMGSGLGVGGHRDYKDLADLSTHEMSTTHQYDDGRSDVMYLLKHCGSFTVRRAAEMSMEIFTEIDKAEDPVR